MNFSKIAVAALSFNYSPWFVQGQGEEIRHRIGPWELHPIGNDVEDTEFGRILTYGDPTFINVNLKIEGNFETHQPTIEVFTGVGDGQACDEGNMLPNGHDGLTLLFFTDDEYSAYEPLMVTSNGSLGNANIEMKLHDPLAWTALNEDQADVGSFNACVRVTKKNEDTYVSFVDTLVKLNVNAEGTFQTFEKAITVVGTSTKSLEDNQTVEIGMDSYLCGPSDSGDPGRSYKIGQSFSICVGPTDDAIAEYGSVHVAVVGFQDVTCAETIKVVEDGQEMALTTVTANPENYKRANGVIVGSGVSSFETVVTPAYHTGLIAPNEASVTCSGTVELSFTDPNPPSTRFEKAGCVTLDAVTGYHHDLLGGGSDDDVQRCNDICNYFGNSYFVLDCPYTVDNKMYFACYCTNLEPESQLDTCPGANTENEEECSKTLVENSAYDFSFSDREVMVTTYRVTIPEDRRLTASFSTNSGDLLQRHLQESGNSASFGTEVLLSREDNADAAFGNLAAPAADTGAVPSTVMATAAGAVVVAAASLV